MLIPFLNVTGVESLVQRICVALRLDSPRTNTFSSKVIQLFNLQFAELFNMYKVQHGGAQQTQSFFPTSTSASSSSGHCQSRKEIMAEFMNQLHSESSKKSRFDSDLDELNI